MGGLNNMEMNTNIGKYNDLAVSLKRGIRYLVFLLVSLSFSGQASASSADTINGSITNHQIWIDFYPHYYINKKLEYYGDAGYRTIVSERNWSRLYVRPSVKYHFNKTWELSTGVGFFYIFNVYDIDQFEIRPWQGGQLNWPQWKKIGFKNLLRIEERISYLTNNWSSGFELRMRYKISGKYDFHKKMYLSFYGEYFLPVSGEIKELYSNKGRSGIGLGYKPDKNWKLEFVFNWQGSRAGADDRFEASDFIYQLKIKKVWKRLIL